MNRVKKEIILITILSFLNLMGCGYTTETISPNEYNKFEKENGQPSGIFVVLSDSARYHFNAQEYRIDNDTLFGEGVQVINDSEIPFNENIPINKIISISVEEPNKIYVFIGFITIVVPISILLYWAITWNNN